MDGFSALICDLDNTLFDTRDIPRPVLAPVHAAVRAANVGPNSIPNDMLEEVIEAAWTRPFDALAAAYALPVRLVDAWNAAHAQIIVTSPLTPYPDVWVLGELPVVRFLVTTGYRRFQLSKIAALGVWSLFHSVYIDALDAPTREGKHVLFERIGSQLGLRPYQVLVLGDSAEAELQVGLQLGMTTVQVLRAGILPSPIVQHHITTFQELLNLRGQHRPSRDG